MEKDTEIGLKPSVLKALPTGWKDEADSMSEEELRNSIIQSETQIRQVEMEMDADDRLNGAKEIVKDLRGPYSDAKKTQKAKIAYALHLLDQKGKL